MTTAHRYALLLRGINVGGNQKIAMADLRALLGDLGFRDVRTLLNSGNAVLTAEAAPADVISEVERGIDKAFGLRVTCLLRTGDELRAVIEGNPFSEVATDGRRMLALFLSAQPDRALLAEHDPVALDPDNIRVGDRVVYQWCPDGFLAAPSVGPYVEKRLGVRASGRNWNTVLKLATLLDG